MVIESTAVTVTMLKADGQRQKPSIHAPESVDAAGSSYSVDGHKYRILNQSSCIQVL